jgi:hypothetical protein
MTKWKTTKEQIIQWPQEKLQKDRQYHDHSKSYTGQKEQWPNEKLKKDRKYNEQKKRDKKKDNTMTKR